MRKYFSGYTLKIIRQPSGLYTAGFSKYKTFEKLLKIVTEPAKPEPLEKKPASAVRLSKILLQAAQAKKRPFYNHRI